MSKITIMPIGHNQGVPLVNIPSVQLRSTRGWCAMREEKGDDWRDLINAIDEILSERASDGEGEG